jgi:hypothetical protein
MRQINEADSEINSRIAAAFTELNLCAFVTQNSSDATINRGFYIRCFFPIVK